MFWTLFAIGWLLSPILAMQLMFYLDKKDPFIVSDLPALLLFLMLGYFGTILVFLIIIKWIISEYGYLPLNTQTLKTIFKGENKEGENE
jgi:hypothetical protein